MSNIVERVLTGNAAGPMVSNAAVYVAATGTAVVFSNGLAVNYSGFGIYNPLGTGTQTGVKALVRYFTYTPTANGTAINVVALEKVLCSMGTGTGFTAGASTGGVFQMGVAGTSTNARCQVFGTGSMMIAPQYIQFSATIGTGGNSLGGETLQPFEGEIVCLPGEGVAITQTVGGTGLASICWVEVPL
jgi:hypothetical protein